MECELCGQDSDSLKKVKIEGATLKVCESCADMGSEVSTPSQKKKKTSSKNRTSKKRDNKVLVDNYGEKVREERNERDMTIQDLADDINEKSSVVRKIEREDLKPEKSLAKTLSQKLGISLYTNPEAWDQETDKGDDRKATLGDVAEVKD
ncbi:MAG: multiprotein bridging factor aMBF1 [Candidatus Nanohaloarchaea archaeon]